MDIQGLYGLMEKLKGDLGGGLVSSSIVSLADGQALVSYNTTPVLDAMATQATSYLVGALAASSMGAVGDYYLMDLPQDAAWLVLLANGYWWGIIIDKKQVSVGLLTNVVLADAVKNFKSVVL